MLVTGNISYQADSSASPVISGMLQKPFNIPYEEFARLIYKKPTHYSFWLKLDLANRRDSSLQLYFYCGSFNYTDVYFVSNNRVIQHAPGGDLHETEIGKTFIGNLLRSFLCD